MTPIFWTPSARRDLRAIRDFVARDSRVYARRLVAKIKQSVTRLRRFPDSGSIGPEFERTEIREVIVGNYRVIYRVKPQAVEILNVVHGARQMPPLDSSE